MGSRRHSDRDIDAAFDEHAVVVTGPKHEAAGVKAVMVSLQRGLESMGAVRTAAALARLNQRHGHHVDLVSEFTNGDGELQERRAKDFMVVAYSTPRGNAAAYYPETNPLVALDHVAKKSNTPVSKAIVIRLEPA